MKFCSTKNYFFSLNKIMGFPFLKLFRVFFLSLTKDFRKRLSDDIWRDSEWPTKVPKKLVSSYITVSMSL